MLVVWTMINDDRVLALIPARGGSERFPGKNIALLAGKPLVVWSIEAALQSKYVDKVVVSTEDDRIAAVGKTAGAEVPFKRPEKLARSTTSSMVVAQHALSELELQGWSFGYLLLLQPTSPLRTGSSIDNAVECFQKKGADALIGVTETDHPLEWENELPESLSMESFFGSKINQRSQDFPKRYRVNGAIFLARVTNFKKENTFFLRKNTYAFIMDREVSVDIDTKFDLLIAERLLEEQLINQRG